MNSIREGSVAPLRRRATYEICVAALRGLNDLSSRRELVTEYFSNIAELSDPIELRDATILLNYCSTAAVYGHFDMDPTVLHKWTSTLIKNLDARLKEDLSTGARCTLLEIRGTAESLWFRRGTSPELNPAGMVGFWTKMLRLLPSAPLFPLDSFADILTILAPHFAGDRDFEHLTQRTDELLEKRTSGYIAADKARDRAIAFLDDDKILFAIRQLHIAKIKWFSAETLRGSVLSILLLSDCYLRLGLIYASKYYSAAAVALAASADNDEIKRLIAGAFRAHFDACYAGGEWFTAARLLTLVFGAHNGYDPDAYDIGKYDRLRNLLVHVSILRVLTRKLAPASLTTVIERIANEWPIGPDFRELIDGLFEEASKSWEGKDCDAIRDRMEADLFGRPFFDVGRKRTVVWRALGIQWTVTFDNERDVVAVCEEFLATLQIVLADLATTDLVLLPTAVYIEMSVTATSNVATSEAPSNEEAIWRVELPRRLLDDQRNARELIPDVIALVSVLLGKCSTLSRDAFHTRLETAFKEGLFAKTMVVRPYAQLYSEIIGPDDFGADVRSRHDPLFVRENFSPHEAVELEWKDGDAPGYSRGTAEEFIANRYARTIPPIRFSLPRLLCDPIVGPRLRALREQGLKDWEILLLIMNRVARYRIDEARPPTLEEHKRLMSEFVKTEESDTATPVPQSAFSDEEIQMQLMTGTATMAKTWGLVLHRQTPDFAALRRLLEVRYHITRDDIPHTDIFLESVDTGA
jgi:hypothetical protein